MGGKENLTKMWENSKANLSGAATMCGVAVGAKGRTGWSDSLGMASPGLVA